MFFPAPFLAAGGFIALLAVAGGFLIATNNIYKVYALRHIDTTILLPIV